MVKEFQEILYMNKLYIILMAYIILKTYHVLYII